MQKLSGRYMRIQNTNLILMLEDDRLYGPSDVANQYATRAENRTVHDKIRTGIYDFGRRNGLSEAFDNCERDEDGVPVLDKMGNRVCLDGRIKKWYGRTWKSKLFTIERPTRGHLFALVRVLAALEQRKRRQERLYGSGDFESKSRANPDPALLGQAKAPGRPLPREPKPPELSPRASSRRGLRSVLAPWLVAAALLLAALLGLHHFRDATNSSGPGSGISYAQRIELWEQKQENLEMVKYRPKLPKQNFRNNKNIQKEQHQIILMPLQEFHLVFSSNSQTFLLDH